MKLFKTMFNTITSTLATFVLLLAFSSGANAMMASAQCLETAEALQDALVLHQDGISKQRTLETGRMLGHNLNIWKKVVDTVYSGDIPVLGGFEGQRLTQALVNEANKKCMGSLMDFMMRVQ